ncbi:BQ5605_C003g02529 [Microbotryum silenes-dioicae]|uniref:BQ5605_C003g02529 protein n=1 Tax=Microbotryum silenes-dioicae TaxID=796604 RepID=A0A2X0MWC7_9BASI|nr:BQ5605_C003g02529 [Microbotryum silenes-dioicae]
MSEGIWAKRADNSARRLWSALSPTPHPVFVDFVCPVVSRSERRLVELRVLFFHSIWKLCRRRRFSSDLLEPITETEFEGLRASIQESKGRLVSLLTRATRHRPRSWHPITGTLYSTKVSTKVFKMPVIINIEPSFALTSEEFAILSPVADLRLVDLLAYDLPAPDASLRLALSKDDPRHFDALPRPLKQSIGKFFNQSFLSLAYLDGYRSIAFAVSGSSAEKIRYIIHNIQEQVSQLANADAIREHELASARHHLTRIRWTAVDRVYLRGRSTRLQDFLQILSELRLVLRNTSESTVRQGVPPNVNEAGLNQVLDRLRLVGSEPLPCIMRREECDALLSVTALDIDQEALIDAVDAGFDQVDAEEEDRQFQTILAEACHEHEQSTRVPNQWEAPPYPRDLLEKGALYSVPTLDLDSLLARRRAHQCRHLEKIKFKGLKSRQWEWTGIDSLWRTRGTFASGANIREKTLQEQATTAIITEGRSHDKMKGRQEVYGQIMSNHVLVRAVDVSALRSLKVDTLVVYGIPEEPMGLPSGEQCGERLAIGIGMPNYYLLRNIYKKSSTTYESVEKLRVIAPEVYSNLSHQGNTRIRQVDGRCIINSLKPDLSSINYEVKDSTRSNWRDEGEIHITVNQEKRYRLLQNIKGI